MGRGQPLLAPQDRNQAPLQVREDQLGEIAEDLPEFIGCAHGGESTHTIDERNAALRDFSGAALAAFEHRGGDLDDDFLPGRTRRRHDGQGGAFYTNGAHAGTRRARHPVHCDVVEDVHEPQSTRQEVHRQ